LADFLTLRPQKGVGHAAADQQSVYFAEQVFNHRDFVGHFGTA
jgi:hypothetical protein